MGDYTPLSMSVMATVGEVTVAASDHLRRAGEDCVVIYLDGGLSLHGTLTELERLADLMVLQLGAVRADRSALEEAS